MGSTTSNIDAPRSEVASAAPRDTPTQRTTQRDAPAPRRPPKADGLASQSRNRTRVAPGIYKDRWGLATTVKVNGVQREVRFPPGTSLKTIRARRDELRASLRTLPRGTRQTLAPDAERYPQQVTRNLIGSAERRRDIEVWLPKFGHLPTLALVEHLAALNAQTARLAPYPRRLDL